MEEFTSQDPAEEITTDYPYMTDQMEVLEEEDLFLSDQVTSDQGESQDQISADQADLLNETRQIKDLLRDYLVETSTEETTDYIKLIYDDVSRQNEYLGSLESKVVTIAKDQQTIGLLSVGASILLIGALGVFFFLWRVR